MSGKWSLEESEGVVMHETDEAIYSRYLAEHNEGDFRILLERHRESLILFLMSFVHNMEDAEELMIDAYAEAAAGVSFLGKSTFKTWLFSVGKKMALMRLRKKRLFFIPLEKEMGKTTDSLELELIHEESKRQLYQALLSLKEEYRQILLLLYFEDMSHEEIELVMGKNRKQIYNLAERGRRVLREELERKGFDDTKYR